MEKKYNLIFNGLFQLDVDEEQAKKNVINTLKLNDQQARNFFSGKQVVVKRNSSLKELIPLKNFLKKSGLTVYTEEIINNSEFFEEHIIAKQDNLFFKKFIIGTLSLSLLILISATAYYFLIVQPKQLEIEQSVQYTRLQLQIDDIERSRKQAVRQKYDMCISEASQNYHSFWASSCKSVADDNKIGLENCLKRMKGGGVEDVGRAMCESQYTYLDYDANCSLPRDRAEDVNNYTKEQKQQCLLEYNMEI